MPEREATGQFAVRKQVGCVSYAPHLARKSGAYETHPTALRAEWRGLLTTAEVFDKPITEVSSWEIRVPSSRHQAPTGAAVCRRRSSDPYAARR